MKLSDAVASTPSLPKILLRLVDRLCADECRLVRVLAMNDRDQSRPCQLVLAAVGDGDLGRAFQIDATVIGRECVGRQVDDFAARLHAANAGAPAVLLECPVDVDRHRIGGIHPAVFFTLVTVSVLLEGKFLDRLGLGTVGQS